MDIFNLPKAELHCHLDGSLSLPTLQKLLGLPDSGPKKTHWPQGLMRARVSLCNESRALLVLQVAFLARPVRFERIALPVPVTWPQDTTGLRAHSAVLAICEAHARSLASDSTQVMIA